MTSISVKSTESLTRKENPVMRQDIINEEREIPNKAIVCG